MRKMTSNLLAATALMTVAQFASADLTLTQLSPSQVGVTSSNSSNAQRALLITTDGTVETNTIYFTDTNMGIADPAFIIADPSIGQAVYDAQLATFESILSLNIEQWFSVDFLNENNTSQTLPDGLLVDFNAVDAPVTVYLYTEGLGLLGGPITLVPEPASLALLGLGGLAMLRRR